MPRAETLALHATAVAIGRRALLIRGPSRSGKSSLAAALIAGSRPFRRVALIGDDRVLLSRDATGTPVARPHPRIAGFLERRGLGIVAVPFRAEAPVTGVVELGAVDPPPAALYGLPALTLIGCESAAEAADRVNAWWDATGRAGADARGAAEAPQVAGKLR